MDRLSASEAVYGYADALTANPATTANDFVFVQALSPPRNGWQQYINPMPASEVDDSPEGLLNAWEQAKDALATAKAAEARLRKAAIAAIYPDGIGEGANTVELADGVKLTATGKINYKLDSDTDKVEKVLDKLEKSGPEGKLLADRLVSWKPSLAVGEYRQLDDKYRKIIDTVITTSDGMPSLEIKRAK